MTLLENKTKLSAFKKIEKFNRKLTIANQKIMQESKYKERFFACITHDLRNPLQSILGCLEILSEQELGFDQKEMVLQAKENGEMLRNLIGNILDYSKIDAGKMELDVQVYNLNQQINKIIKMNSELEQKKSKFF